MAQRCGDIKDLEIVYHRSGPQRGKSKGWGFVTYVRKEDAARAIHVLNGMFIEHRKLYARWAQPEKEVAAVATKTEVPALIGAKDESHAQSSVTHQIQAIERKLKMMEEKPDLENYLLESKRPRIQNPLISNKQQQRKYHAHKRENTNKKGRLK